MTVNQSVGKDRIAAVLLVLLGGTVAYVARGYDVGTLHRMGPGFIPVVLGLLLLAAGVLIGISASEAPAAEKGAHLPRDGARGVDVRAWVCILGGVAAFVVLGERGGLVPATFSSVFIAAMGDRSNSLRDALLLAGAMAVVALVLFSWALKLQMPALTWL